MENVAPGRQHHANAAPATVGSLPNSKPGTGLRPEPQDVDLSSFNDEAEGFIGGMLLAVIYLQAADPTFIPSLNQNLIKHL
ncbi:hypothetical protein R50073_38460 [Maricurvus nonylphenolicus]